jgi:two-component system NarL family response regulator
LGHLPIGRKEGESTERRLFEYSGDSDQAAIRITAAKDITSGAHLVNGAAPARREALNGTATAGSQALEAAPLRLADLIAEPRGAGPRVLVAESGLGIRRGIRLALEAAGLIVCSEVGHAEHAIEEAVRARPDICLLDLRLPGGGLHAAARICGRVSETAVVILADEVSDDELFDALRIGACGFVLKSINHARLPHVLRGVLRGEAALPRQLVGRLALEFKERARRRHIALPNTRGVELTTREWEIVDLLRQGLTTRHVAERLGVAQVTVRRHVGDVVKKLHVQNRAEALALLQNSRA